MLFQPIKLQILCISMISKYIVMYLINISIIAYLLMLKILNLQQKYRYEDIIILGTHNFIFLNSTLGT